MYYHGGDAAGQVGERDKLTDSILDASVAPEAWRLELERVTPQLKMQVRCRRSRDRWQLVGYHALHYPSIYLSIHLSIYLSIYPSIHLSIYLPQVLSDPKEWRNRLVNTKSHHAKVAQLTPETHATVERLADDLERTLAAVRKAEQKLSQQLQAEILEYTAKQEEMLLQL